MLHNYLAGQSTYINSILYCCNKNLSHLHLLYCNQWSSSGFHFVLDPTAGFSQLWLKCIVPMCPKYVGSGHTHYKKINKIKNEFQTMTAVTKIQKYSVIFVYILQGQMGKTEKTRKKIMQLKWPKYQKPNDKSISIFFRLVFNMNIVLITFVFYF